MFAQEADPATHGDEEPRVEPARGARCEACGGETRFDGGVSTHDLYAQRFVCVSCGRETYRSFGRGSVS